MSNKVLSEKLIKVKKKATNKYLDLKVNLQAFNNLMIFIKFWMVIQFLKSREFGKEYIKKDTSPSLEFLQISLQLFKEKRIEELFLKWIKMNVNHHKIN